LAHILLDTLCLHTLGFWVSKLADSKAS
jgi:hypothetical protein